MQCKAHLGGTRTHCEGGRGGEQLEAVLHVYELLLDGAVVAAKVVERRIELLHQRYEQHSIAHRQNSIRNSLHSKDSDNASGKKRQIA